MITCYFRVMITCYFREMITLEDNSTASIWEFMNSSLDDTSDRTRPEQIVLTIVFVIYTIIGILGKV